VGQGNVPMGTAYTSALISLARRVRAEIEGIEMSLKNT
jgi:hypothetical protein